MALFQDLLLRIINKAMPSTRPYQRPPQSTMDVLAEKSERELLQRIRDEEAERIRKESQKGYPKSTDEFSKVIDKSFKDIFANEQKKREHENRMREEMRAREPWYRFVHLGIPITNGSDFQSSNVHMVQYDVENKSLYIEYRTGHSTDGRTYRYWPIDERMAAAAYNASSKGIFVWDNLRIRGTLLGHRVNYMLVGGSMLLNNLLPKWTATEASIEQHEAQVGAESGAAGPARVLGLGETGAQPAITQPYKALGKFMRTQPRLRPGSTERTQ